MSGHKVYTTPLLNKIGIREKQSLLLIEAPVFILELIHKNQILYHTALQATIQYDLIWSFVNTITALENQLIHFKKAITSNGVIWISWYKKSSGFISELNENIIRNTALAIDLVDIKVASVDERWSALKLVIPLKKR